MPYDRFDPHKLKLAMKLGRDCRLRDISIRNWRKLAPETRLGEEAVVAAVEAMADRLSDAAARLRSDVKASGLSHPIVDKLADLLAERGNGPPLSPALCIGKEGALRHSVRSVKNLSQIPLRSERQPMPITAFLRADSKFQPKAVKAMRDAYKDALSAAGVADGGPAGVREIIAHRIIIAAEQGESEPNRLCDVALRSLGLKR